MPLKMETETYAHTEANIHQMCSHSAATGKKSREGHPKQCNKEKYDLWKEKTAATLRKQNSDNAYALRPRNVAAELPLNPESWTLFDMV